MNISRRALPFWAPLAFLAGISLGGAPDQGPPPQGRVATATASDGQKWTGRIAGDPKAGFVFLADQDGPSLPLDRAGVIIFEGPDTSDLKGTPPFRVELGYDQAISGRLVRIDEATIRLDDGPGGKPVEVARAGALAFRPRPGEALVLLEPFEQWDDARWSRMGDPKLDATRPFEGQRSLALDGESASVTHRLPRPVAAGRLELACFLDGKKAEGRRWFVDLTFRGPMGEPAPVRVVLGWTGDGAAVETPEGPSLVVQRLTPEPGWHRLTARFGAGERLDLALDGMVLAHGQGPSGPLVEIRIGSDPKAPGAGPDNLVGLVDDLKLFRSVQPPRSVEVDPTQDEVRLLSGDQFFGTIREADARSVAFEIEGKVLPLSWTEVAGLRFRRRSVASAPIDGLLVRVEWDGAPGRQTDQVEGSLVAANAAGLTVKTPFAGTLTVPADRLRRLWVVGQGRRIVLDPGRHHLGDQYMATLDPPQSEGGVLELPFDLEAAPAGPAAVVIDVVEVAGESPNLPFAEQLKNNSLRTNLTLNGKLFDRLNRHITDLNEIPRRIRLPIPKGLLKAGANVLRFDQVGKADDPAYLDDLGILGIALEFAPPEAPNP